MKEDIIDTYKKYRQALKEIYNSPQGKIIFDYLKKTYLEASAFDVETNSLVYKLAGKELIQNLILEAETEYKEENNLSNEYGYI